MRHTALEKSQVLISFVNCSIYLFGNQAGNLGENENTGGRDPMEQRPLDFKCGLPSRYNYRAMTRINNLRTLEIGKWKKKKIKNKK